MSRKGISPLIAAVLLIAFTMAVASLFAQWAPQLIQSAQGDTMNKSSQIQSCSGAIVEFVDASDQKATLQQVAGEKAVGKMKITWFYEGKDPVQNTTYINESRGVNTVKSGTTGTLKEITMSPVNCQGAPGATYTP